MINNTIEEIDLKFRSGNDIEVERVTLKRDEWLAVKQQLAQLQDERNGYKDNFERSAKREDKLSDISWQSLHNLIDITWNEATESDEVPSHQWADEIIAKWCSIDEA